MRKYFLLLCLLLVADLFAQNSTPRLTGKITDANGAPLQGIVITNRTMKQNSVSSNSGSFGVNALKGDTILFTHINFLREQIVYDGTSPVQIKMQASVNNLEDVTVSTGYQVVSKERVTGSFEKINNEALNLQPGTDVLSRLNGVSSAFFDPNLTRAQSKYGIIIRGLSSINGPREPLVIVDNFPYEGNLSNLNPNDIENVTILKDAAAASIWGAKAGNGVIVITTKKATFNQSLRVDVSSNITVRNKPDLFYMNTISSSDLIDSEQFLYGKGFYNSRITSTSRPALTPTVEILIKKAAGQITAAEADAQINALRNTDVRNDFNKYFYRAAVNQQHAISLRAGSDKTSFLLSGGFDKNISELDAGYDRKNISSQLTMAPARNLVIKASMRYTESVTGSGKPGYAGYPNVMNNWPYAQFADADGNALPVYRGFRKGYLDTAGLGKLLDWNYYPLEDWKHNTTTTTLRDLVWNIGIQYKIFRGLSVELSYNHETQQAETIAMRDMESYQTRNMINLFTQINWATGVVKYNLPKGSIQDRKSATLLSNSGRAQINYERNWKKHELSIIGGNEIRSNRSFDDSYTMYGFNEEVLGVSNVDFVNAYPSYITGSTSTIPSNVSFNDKKNNFVSFYANAGYTYDKRYSVTASARRDASNLFGVRTNDKWQPLWSTGAAWNIHNESFYHSKLFPYLKLRATYGVSGNADQTRSAVTTFSYASAPNPASGLPQGGISEFGNPDLRWERVYMTNIAVDFATRNNRFSGSVETYFKKATDLIGPTSLDITTGLPDVIKNVASMRGNGVDVLMNVKLLDRSIKWDAGIQFSYAATRVTDYFITNVNGSTFINNGQLINPVIGNPVYSIYSYRWGGLDNKGAPIGYIAGKPSQDYSSITGSGTSLNDLVYHGSALPVVFGSLRNTISYKALSVSVNLSYKFNYYYRKAVTTYSNLFNQGIGNTDFANRWKQPGDELFTNTPAMIYPAVTNSDVLYLFSEPTVKKADHIRLQFVNVAWDVPKLGNTGIKNMKLYFNASNLGIIWSANKDGRDPDYVDGLKPTASFTGGINLTF